MQKVRVDRRFKDYRGLVNTIRHLGQPEIILEIPVDSPVIQKVTDLVSLDRELAQLPVLVWLEVEDSTFFYNLNQLIGKPTPVNLPPPSDTFSQWEKSVHHIFAEFSTADQDWDELNGRRKPVAADSSIVPFQPNFEVQVVYRQHELYTLYRQLQKTDVVGRDTIVRQIIELRRVQARARRIQASQMQTPVTTKNGGLFGALSRLRLKPRLIWSD